MVLEEGGGAILDDPVDSGSRPGPPERIRGGKRVEDIPERREADDEEPTTLPAVVPSGVGAGGGIRPIVHRGGTVLPFS